MDDFSSPYSLGLVSGNRGGMLYVRKDIPSGLQSIDTKPVEGFYIELNVSNRKWLINCFYTPHKNMTDNYLQALKKYLDLHSSSL